jgi:hypothetical protein
MHGIFKEQALYPKQSRTPRILSGNSSGSPETYKKITLRKDPFFITRNNNNSSDTFHTKTFAEPASIWYVLKYLSSLHRAFMSLTPCPLKQTVALRTARTVMGPKNHHDLHLRPVGLGKDVWQLEVVLQQHLVVNGQVEELIIFYLCLEEVSIGRIRNILVKHTTSRLSSDLIDECLVIKSPFLSFYTNIDGLQSEKQRRYLNLKSIEKLI